MREVKRVPNEFLCMHPTFILQEFQVGLQRLTPVLSWEPFQGFNENNCTWSSIVGYKVLLFVSDKIIIYKQIKALFCKQF